MGRGECPGKHGISGTKLCLTVMGLYAAKNAVVVAMRLQLGNTAARLLNHMALECWDEPRGEQAARRYFAGRESSAIALGFGAPDNASEAAHRAVKRAIRELIDRGAICRIRTGGRGQTSEYELLLDSSRPPSARRGSDEPIPFPSQGTNEWSPQRASF